MRQPTRQIEKHNNNESFLFGSWDQASQKMHRSTVECTTYVQQSFKFVTKERRPLLRETRNMCFSGEFVFLDSNRTGHVVRVVIYLSSLACFGSQKHNFAKRRPNSAWFDLFLQIKTLSIKNIFRIISDFCRKCMWKLFEVAFASIRLEFKAGIVGAHKGPFGPTWARPGPTKKAKSFYRFALFRYVHLHSVFHPKLISTRACRFHYFTSLLWQDPCQVMPNAIKFRETEPGRPQRCGVWKTNPLLAISFRLKFQSVICLWDFLFEVHMFWRVNQ